MRGAKRFTCLIMVVFLFTGLSVGAAASDYERVVVTYTGPQVVAGYDYNTGDEYSKFILDKFNFEFQGTNVPWGDWHSMLSTWIMAQDMTDVANYNYTDGTA
ncbi:MAG: hypothetical protein ABIK64_03340, partial [Bacillota bacterium]